MMKAIISYIHDLCHDILFRKLPLLFLRSSVILCYYSSSKEETWMMKSFPIIDLAATGSNIRQLRIERGLSVRDLQSYFGFE